MKTRSCVSNEQVDGAIGELCGLLTPMLVPLPIDSENAENYGEEERHDL